MVESVIVIDKKIILSAALEKDPQEDLLKLESRLSKLIQRMILEKPYAHIILAERKGSALFNQFIPRLLETYISIRVFRFDKGHPVIRVISVSKDKNFFSTIKIFIRRLFLPTKIFGEPGIFLTDTIGKGKEFRSAYKTAKLEGIQITDVYGYIAKKEGLDILKKEYPKIHFCFVEELEIPKDEGSSSEPWKSSYWKNHLELMSYFQSRMIPLDIDHPNFTYKFLSGLDKPTIKKIIDDTLYAIAGQNYYHWDDDLTPIPGFFGCSVELYNPELMRDYSTILISDDIYINRITIRFKINFIQCILVVTIFPEIILNRELDSANDACKDFKIKYCHGNIDESIKNSICPQCIDDHFSKAIYKLLNNILINHDMSKQYQLTKID